jgi:flagellar basal-body rod modification protein FlgD
MADSGTSSSAGSSSSTISANDFLTLLVTEMQNQDPTSATDPNQYINQLVSVNSLEQLIQINQTLRSAIPASPGSSSGTHSSADSLAPNAGPTSHLSSNAPGSAATTSPGNTHPAQATSGNLGIPATSPAAQTIANALIGLTHQP